MAGVAFAAWLLVCLGAMLGIAKYSTSPGAEQGAPPRWPAGSRVTLAGTNLTLVMLAHPQCPCTEATIGELELVMARAQGRLSAHVLFLQPDGFSPAWVETGLWRRAAAIPGVTVYADPAGAEATRFHALNSGDTLVYGNDGKLLFQGGITASRGHSGDNAGRDAIEALFDGERGSSRQATPVFGCPLFENQCKTKTQL